MNEVRVRWNESGSRHVGGNLASGIGQCMITCIKMSCFELLKPSAFGVLS